MSKLFGRVVSLTVGLPGQANPKIITDLRMTFKIEKTLIKYPNNSTIEIYNLSPASRSLFEKKGASVRLTAGYTGSAKDLFIGDIASAVTKRTGPDIIMSVEAGDGLSNFQTKEADLSFGPGTKTQSILNSMTAAFGLTKGEVQGIDPNDEYLNGAVFSGRVSDHMDTITGKAQDLDWSIQDGKLQILPKNAGSVRPAVLLTPQTGLISSPFKRVVLNQAIAKKVDSQLAENGLKLTSLLNPDLVPGRLVVVKAEFVSGTFKIVKATHQGDTHGNNFFTEIEAITI